MNCYIYQSEVYCEDCGHDIIFEIDSKERGFISDDSNEFPQFDEVGESDSPQHCAGGESCVNGHDGRGMFFENALTAEGRQYVIETFHRDPTNPVVQEWVNYYEYKEIEDDDFIRGWLAYQGGDSLKDAKYSGATNLDQWRMGWKLGKTRDHEINEERELLDLE